MDKRFLLTYFRKVGNNSYVTYEWFNTEEEMKEFIDEQREYIVEIHDAIEIYTLREINLETD